MAFSTAKSATSGGRVLMCGASLEPVRLAVCSASMPTIHNNINYISNII